MLCRPAFEGEPALDAQTVFTLLLAGFGALTLLRLMAALREALTTLQQEELRRAERRRQREAAMLAVATGV